MKNHYTVLGVASNATLEAIKKAYRKLSKQVHPDKNPGDASANQRMQDVNAAWAVLGDATRRAAHDLDLARAARAEASHRAKEQRQPQYASTSSGSAFSIHPMILFTFIVGIIVLLAAMLLADDKERSETTVA